MRCRDATAELQNPSFSEHAVITHTVDLPLHRAPNVHLLPVLGAGTSSRRTRPRIEVGVDYKVFIVEGAPSTSFGSSTSFAIAVTRPRTRKPLGTRAVFDHGRARHFHDCMRVAIRH